MVYILFTEADYHLKDTAVRTCYYNTSPFFLLFAYFYYNGISMNYKDEINK